jgi:transcription elongation factor Elf1
MSQSKNDKAKRQYISVPTVLDTGIPCRHCGARFGHKVTNTYANGNRRRICGKCGLPFVTVRASER